MGCLSRVDLPARLHVPVSREGCLLRRAPLDKHAVAVEDAYVGYEAVLSGPPGSSGDPLPRQMPFRIVDVGELHGVSEGPFVYRGFPCSKAIYRRHPFMAR